MTDGLGSVSYVYDQLSRVTSETRQFADPVTPFLNAPFTLSYSYNLAGEVASVTDPTGVAVNYGHDKMGRLSGVTGTSFANVSTFASGMQYRAFGGLKPDDAVVVVSALTAYDNNIVLIWHSSECRRFQSNRCG